VPRVRRGGGPRDAGRGTARFGGGKPSATGLVKDGSPPPVSAVVLIAAAT